MRSLIYTMLLLVSAGFRWSDTGNVNNDQTENIEFACMKMHKASNTCHFNFKVDGAKYRYVDIGCKFSKRKDELIAKAKDGSVALSKDWKVECPEPKKEEGL